jgi:hypothetical protein
MIDKEELTEAKVVVEEETKEAVKKGVAGSKAVEAEEEATKEEAIEEMEELEKVEEVEGAATVLENATAEAACSEKRSGPTGPSYPLPLAGRPPYT